jgi:hypothetical protein
MSKIDLHKFRDDLLKKPPLGVKAPPIGIRATDLDDNFRKITVIEGRGTPPAYKVKYTKDGTLLTDISGLPKDAIAKEFDVCENGQPRTWWFVVWENEPELPQ